MFGLEILRYIPQRKALLFLGDFLIVVLAIPLAYVVLTGKIENFYWMISTSSWIYFFLIFVWMVMLFLTRAYHAARVADVSHNLRVFSRVAIIATLLLGFLFFLIPDVVFSRRVLVGHGFFIILLAILWRVLFGYLITRPRFKVPVVIVGAGPAGKMIAGELLRSAGLGYELIGFVDEPGAKWVWVKAGRHRGRVAVLGSGDDLPKIVRERKIQLLVDAVHGAKGAQLLRALSAVEMGFVKIIPMHHLYEYITAKIPIQHVGGEWLFFNELSHQNRFRLALDRIANFVAATALLILAAPLIGAVALAIGLDSSGGALYRQTRVGLGGKRFTIYKFRSMRKDAENGVAVWAKENDPRVTRVGRVIRKLRIDELPQLINVWKGDMNLVGPRPERPEFVEKLEKEIPFYQKRHLVKPGITGWAQVKYTYGANAEDALEKLQYELYHIKRRSLLFDLIILLKTVDIVLTGRGAR